jgi:hypothetical protein
MIELSVRVFAYFEDEGVEAITDPTDRTVLLGHVGPLIEVVEVLENLISFFKPNTPLRIRPQPFALPLIEVESHK